MSRFVPIAQDRSFAATGTIMGLHTPAELHELIAAKDYEHAQMQATFDANAASINAKDPTWLADWRAFLARYGAAKAEVLARNDSFTAEGSWKEILASLTLNPSQPYTPQDEQGLFVRLQKAGAQPDVSHVPQPGADTDLGIYRGADDLIKAGTQGANQALSDVGGVFSHPVVIGAGLLLAVGGFFYMTRHR